MKNGIDEVFLLGLCQVIFSGCPVVHYSDITAIQTCGIVADVILLVCCYIVIDTVDCY